MAIRTSFSNNKGFNREYCRQRRSIGRCGVCRHIYQCQQTASRTFKNKSKNKKEVDWKVIAKTEKESMETVWERYKNKNVDEIIALLHTFPEWKDVYKKEKVSIPTEKILEGKQEGFPEVNVAVKEYDKEQTTLEAGLNC